MKYTDTLFSFPIRVYDGFSVRKNMRKEEALIDDLEAPLEDDWVRGTAKLPIKEIQGIIDNFSEGRNPEDVVKEGFDTTIVMTKTMGDWVCLWNMKKFEEKLNEFAEKYEKMVEKLADEMIARKSIQFPEHPMKKPWWKRKLL